MRPTFKAGTRVGDYIIVQRVGRGGMGAVYLANHKRTGKEVAVKVFAPDEALMQSLDAKQAKAVFEQGKLRFENEIEIAKRFTEVAGVVQSLGSGKTAGGIPYLVMEYLHPSQNWEALDQRLAREGALKPIQALKILLRVADTLLEIHRRGIVHRDIKPSNILVQIEANGQVFAKVIDLGIAIATNLPRLTRLGDLAVTVDYAPPEVLRGTTPSGPAQDLYALASSTYEALSGGPLPHQGATLSELIRNKCHAPAESLRVHCPLLPAELIELIDRGVGVPLLTPFNSLQEFRDAAEQLLLKLVCANQRQTMPMDSAMVQQACQGSLPPSIAPPPAAPPTLPGWFLPAFLSVASVTAFALGLLLSHAAEHPTLDLRALRAWVR